MCMNVNLMKQVSWSTCAVQMGPRLVGPPGPVPWLPMASQWTVLALMSLLAVVVPSMLEKRAIRLMAVAMPAKKVLSCC